VYNAGEVALLVEVYVSVAILPDRDVFSYPPDGASLNAPFDVVSSLGFI
jgi:hypothetical protein